jgi:hypothetical protein
MKYVLFIYSVFSIVALPFLLYLQVFSMFLFDSGISFGAYLLSFLILMIPILLILGNIFAWKNYKKNKTNKVLFFMIMPIIYPILFFTFWFSLGI